LKGYNTFLLSLRSALPKVAREAEGLQESTILPMEL
jgi:hypothetical protein